jgi:nitroreductase
MDLDRDRGAEPVHHALSGGCRAAAARTFASAALRCCRFEAKATLGTPISRGRNAMSLDKPAVTSKPVHDLIRDRWSPRSFDPNRPVPRAALTALFEAARWAASSNNGQPWRFIVATKDNPAEYEKALGCFTPRNQRWAKTAPVLILVCARKTFEANGNPNLHAWYDAGAAMAMLSIQATAMGLRLHQAAGIERDKARAAYDVPAEFDVCAGIGLGYQGDPDALPEELPGREREPRGRRPLSDIVFAGAFGTSAKLD